MICNSCLHKVFLTETPKRVIFSTGSRDLNPGNASQGRRGWASLVLPTPARPLTLLGMFQNLPHQIMRVEVYLPAEDILC
jgi:hypothetical protein